VADNDGQRIGSEMKGPASLNEYQESFRLAQFAWEIASFDQVEEH
jgi:hypothetical protein